LAAGGFRFTTIEREQIAQGTSSTVVLSNTYHLDNQRGFARAAERVGYSVLQDMGFDVLCEF
jgi:hypothetical protein